MRVIAPRAAERLQAIWDQYVVDDPRIIKKAYARSKKTCAGLVWIALAEDVISITLHVSGLLDSVTTMKEWADVLDKEVRDTISRKTEVQQLHNRLEVIVEEARIANG